MDKTKMDKVWVGPTQSVAIEEVGRVDLSKKNVDD